MRIGVVTASYPRTEGDHAGNFVAAHVAALRAAGHDVEVIGAHTIASDLFYEGGAPDKLERGGLRTYLAAARFSVQLTREVSRREDWDLVIAHWLVPSALAATIATRGVPILAIAHGGDIHTLRRLRILAPTLYALRARGVRLAFVSSELREQARRAAPRLSRWLDESIVQPMGIDTARFAAIRADRTARDRGDSRHVVVVARLVPVKGVDVAIRALQTTRANIQMTIAGDGPERAALEQLAGTDARIRFIGAVDARGLDSLLRDADALVIPSRVLPNGRSEGSPMIASEALAAGVPVIASAVGGLRDLGNITLVRPDDPLALGVALDRVLHEPSAARAASDALASAARDALPSPIAAASDALASPISAATDALPSPISATSNALPSPIAAAPHALASPISGATDAVVSPEALDWKSVASRLLAHAGKSPICEGGESPRRRSA